MYFEQLPHGLVSKAWDHGPLLPPNPDTLPSFKVPNTHPKVVWGVVGEPTKDLET